MGEISRALVAVATGAISTLMVVVAAGVSVATNFAVAVTADVGLIEGIGEPLHAASKISVTVTTKYCGLMELILFP